MSSHPHRRLLIISTCLLVWAAAAHGQSTPRDTGYQDSALRRTTERSSYRTTQRRTTYTQTERRTSTVARNPQPSLGVTSKYYPTGNPSTSILLIERSAPREVRINQDFEYIIYLRNLTNGTLENIVLTENISPDLAVRRISPQPTRSSANRPEWLVGTLGPNATKAFTITGALRRPGVSPSCATVSFNTDLCSHIRAAEPRLDLVKSAPVEVTMCEDIPLRFTVTNTGSGTARNVTINDRLPDGWTTPDGKRTIMLSAGDLAPGQAKTLIADARANTTGQFRNIAVATESGGARSEAYAETRVVRPSLRLTKRAPNVRYLNRPVVFEISAHNDGNTLVRDARLIDRLSPGLRFVAASHGGQFQNGNVTWNLGTIQPGMMKTVNITAMPTRAGRLLNTAEVQAYCAEARAEAELNVRGIPAILLETVDIEDPIEIGTQTTYVISVMNQGSADGTNIAISCLLPDSQAFVSAEGPTQVRAGGQRIEFGPLPRLAPKDTVKYRVVVKGLRKGDVRFKVSLTSDQLSSPVEETESTHIY